MSRRPLHSFRIVALFLLPALAFATEGSGTTSDMSGSLLRLFAGFSLVIALLFGLLWLLKKVSVPRGGAGNLVRVVSAAAIGPRERVVLVDVGGKRLVLGVAPGHVALLDAQSAPETPNTALASEAVAAPAFAQWLQKTLARRNGK